MAFHITTSRVQQSELLWSSAAEQSVEGEYTIPDYKPEIQKILKCVPTPVVMQKLAVGNKVTVEGYVLALILYLTADSEAVCSVQYKLPFSRQFELKSPVEEGALIGVRMGMQFFNCRVAGRRKVDCRGSFSLTLTVRGYADSELLAAAEGDGIQVRRSEQPCCRVAWQADKQFAVDEQLQIEPNGTAEVLRCDAFSADLRGHTAGSAVLLEGSIDIHLLVGYPDAPSTRTYDYRLPFTEQLDADLLPDGEYQVFPSLTVIAAEISQSPDDDALLEASFTCVAEAVVLAQQTALLVSDLYSTEYETADERRQLSLLTEMTPFERPFTVNIDYTQPVTGAQVGECIALPVRLSVREDGRITAVTELSCLVRDADGDAVTLTQEAESEVEGAWPDAEYLELRAVIDACSGAADGAGVRARAAGRIYGLAARWQSCQAVLTVTADTAAKKQPGDVALTIYYASEGEEIWDIAKRYNTAVSEIMENNALTEPTVASRRTLLIPIVK